MHLRLIPLLAATLLATPLVAQPVIDNLGTPSTISDFPAATNSVRNRFTTGAGFDLWQLNSVSVVWGARSTADPMVGVQILNDAAGIPGSVLATLNGATNVGGGGLFVYTSPSILLLDGGTSYWVNFTSDSPGGAGTVLPAGTAPPVLNDGWSLDPVRNVEFFGNYDGNSLFAINARAVPEPTSIALVGIGLMGLGLAARRRQSMRRA